ncbi:hypothetical protein [Pelagibacterium lentulum]|uniref:Uncharacterized protein n=1 Tax=Pelagibacterium lentulum TaxID=2029865 RepID=A0A916RB67_9HYPH|nr:hypothetical protein [Pelagibacterium lentulum]GGA47515.1 hypothetical protein GCM10011499_16680 [Pelagibacterium lentulum]
MFKKSLVSPIALAFGLALTGAAAAQTMVGGQEVTDADLAEVQAHCEALAADETNVNGDVSDDATIQDDATDIGGVDPMAGLDVASITIEECREAGLID